MEFSLCFLRESVWQKICICRGSSTRFRARGIVYRALFCTHIEAHCHSRILLQNNRLFCMKPERNASPCMRVLFGTVGSACVLTTTARTNLVSFVSSEAVNRLRGQPWFFPKPVNKMELRNLAILFVVAVVIHFAKSQDDGK